MDSQSSHRVAYIFHQKLISLRVHKGSRVSVYIEWLITVAFGMHHQPRRTINHAITHLLTFELVNPTRQA